jgi:hypothetical protein
MPRESGEVGEDVGVVDAAGIQHQFDVPAIAPAADPPALEAPVGAEVGGWIGMHGEGAELRRDAGRQPRRPVHADFIDVERIIT